MIRIALSVHAAEEGDLLAAMENPLERRLEDNLEVLLCRPCLSAN